MSGHIKRYVAPNSWGILRKEQKFVTKQLPGAHNIQESIPLDLALKQLGLAKTRREVKTLLNTSTAIIDGKQTKEHKTALGVLDILHIKEINKTYRVMINENGKLIFTQLKENKPTKPCKIIGKQKISGGKTQYSLFPGRNIILEKPTEEYAMGDTLVISLPEQKILQHIKLQTGTKVFIFRGKNAGHSGIIETVKDKTIIYKTENQTEQTLKEYALALSTGENE